MNIVCMLLNNSWLLRGIIFVHALIGCLDLLAKQYNRKIDDSYPFFQIYSKILDTIAYIPFAMIPTPIDHLEKIEKLYDIQKIYIKRDDLTGGISSVGKQLFGGNKIRKLSLLCADAEKYGAQAVLTFGCVGSNHVVATAACAHERGLACIAMLKPQPNSHIVRRNLLLMHYYGVEMHLSENDNKSRALDTVKLLAEKSAKGIFPYIIPTGGSTPLGVIGYVNAAFELKKQIEAGVMPKPDYIYVPAGSCGTVAGLLIGCRAANVETKIVAVAVEPEDCPGQLHHDIFKLVHETNNFLHKCDEKFPLFSWSDDAIHIVHDCCGKDYGLFTQEAINVRKIMQEYEGITLDGTYTSKAFAGLLHDVEKRNLQNNTILFWHTFCGDNFDEQLSSIDYHELPREFHHYFEEDVQELDR